MSVGESGACGLLGTTEFFILPSQGKLRGENKHSSSTHPSVPGHQVGGNPNGAIPKAQSHGKGWDSHPEPGSVKNVNLTEISGRLAAI